MRILLPHMRICVFKQLFVGGIGKPSNTKLEVDMRVVANSEEDKQILLVMESIGCDKWFGQACDLYVRNLELSKMKKGAVPRVQGIPVSSILDKMVMDFIDRQHQNYNIITKTN